MAQATIVRNSIYILINLILGKLAKGAPCTPTAQAHPRAASTAPRGPAIWEFSALRDRQTGRSLLVPTGALPG